MHHQLTLMQSSQLHAIQRTPNTTALSDHFLKQFAVQGSEVECDLAMKLRENQLTWSSRWSWYGTCKSFHESKGREPFIQGLKWYDS